MTVQLISKQAREIAGVYYDQTRSERFRRANPDQNAYVARMWPHFVDLARRALTQLMIAKDTPQHIRDAIEDALIEDNKRAHSGRARNVAQATLEPVEKEDRTLIDSNPQFISRTGAQDGH